MRNCSIGFRTLAQQIANTLQPVRHGQQRPVAGIHQSLEYQLRRSRQADQQAAPGQCLPVRHRDQRAAAGGDHQAAQGGELSAELSLHQPEGRLALFCENGRDRLAGALLDDRIHVDKGAAHLVRHPAAGRGLARAHKAGQNDIAIVHGYLTTHRHNTVRARSSPETLTRGVAMMCLSNTGSPGSIHSSTPWVRSWPSSCRSMARAGTASPGHRYTTLRLPRPASRHQVDTLQRKDASDQHGSRKAIRFGHHIQAIVHAVDEIDVREASGAVHGPVALGASVCGVAGQIIFADISLDLDDAPGGALSVQHAHQVRTKQLPRHEQVSRR